MGQGQIPSIEEHSRSLRGGYIYYRDRQKTKKERWRRVIHKTRKRGKRPRVVQK